MFSFYENFPCPFFHSAQVPIGQVSFCESFHCPFSHFAQVRLGQSFILWKLRWPIFLFCTGVLWPIFHFVKASLANLLILHRFALANVSFYESFPYPNLILHRFAWGKFSFCKSFPCPFSHSAQVRFGQCFILWNLPLSLLSFCTGSPETSFHFLKASLAPSIILHRFGLANV